MGAGERSSFYLLQLPQLAVLFFEPQEGVSVIFKTETAQCTAHYVSHLHISLLYNISYHVQKTAFSVSKMSHV